MAVTYKKLFHLLIDKGMISVDEILDDEQGRVYFATSVGISL